MEYPLGRIPDKFSCIADDHSAADVLVLRVNFAEILRHPPAAISMPCVLHPAALREPRSTLLSGNARPRCRTSAHRDRRHSKPHSAAICAVLHSSVPNRKFAFCRFCPHHRHRQTRSRKYHHSLLQAQSAGKRNSHHTVSPAIACIVAIPRGEIDTKLDTAAPTGIRYLAHNIALSVLPWGCS